MINKEADKILQVLNRSKNKYETIAPIDDELDLLRNGIHVILGERGSGKTYYVSRECLKLALLPKKKQTYTNIFYISNADDDATFNRVLPVLSRVFRVRFVPENEAVELIERIVEEKKRMPPNEKPDTLLIFDDCMYLFNQNLKLNKLLYKTRQPRITVCLILQDVSGIDTAIRQTCNLLVLFGGLSKSKFSIVKRTFPTMQDIEWEDYAKLTRHDMLKIGQK